MPFFSGSVSEGEANRILEVVGEDYFPPNFKEYLLKEQLKWSRVSRHESGNWTDGWVFWSQQDHEIDNCADFNPNVCPIPKVRDNIRHALQKLVSSLGFYGCLAQFWAPTTSEGRTLLTTQYQPFALGRIYGLVTGVIGGHWLCEYRVKMCREYFHSDVESGDEQLGLPGRVFLHKFRESTPDVNYYFSKEYPQQHLAIRCNIKKSLAVPVFEQSSQTCVGVLEIVSLLDGPSVWHESFLRHMHGILQEFRLQCFDGDKICEMQSRGRIKRRKGLTPAFQELNRVLRSVCGIHELPLAMTWVPCSACNGIMRGQLRSKYSSTGVEFCAPIDSPFSDFLKIGKCSHLRKELVAGRAFPSLDMLYCSDITQLSVDEYPLVPYARQCKLSSWFTICLQSGHTGNAIYVLEFFLSARSEDDENILTRLSFILGTMEEKFQTFRLASGKELGELMPFEFIHVQNDQKIHSVQVIQATRNFSHTSSDPSSEESSASVGKESSASVASTRPGFQDANIVTIKAKYADYTIRFKLSLPYRLIELHREVAKRLNLDPGTYDVHYEDELAELILIACDEDLQDCVDTSISLGKSIVVFIMPKQPITSSNPTN